jgi:hypothetical protein
MITNLDFQIFKNFFLGETGKINLLRAKKFGFAFFRSGGVAGGDGFAAQGLSRNQFSTSPYFQKQIVAASAANCCGR